MTAVWPLTWTRPLDSSTYSPGFNWCARSRCRAPSRVLLKTRLRICQIRSVDHLRISFLQIFQVSAVSQRILRQGVKGVGVCVRSAKRSWQPTPRIRSTKINTAHGNGIHDPVNRHLSVVRLTVHHMIVSQADLQYRLPIRGAQTQIAGAVPPAILRMMLFKTRIHVRHRLPIARFCRGEKTLEKGRDVFPRRCGQGLRLLFFRNRKCFKPGDLLSAKRLVLQDAAVHNTGFASSDGHSHEDTREQDDSQYHRPQMPGLRGIDNCRDSLFQTGGTRHGDPESCGTCRNVLAISTR